MTEKETYNALRTALPTWQKDNLGVRGNPIAATRQQAQIHWPAATITRSVEPSVSTIKDEIAAAAEVQAAVPVVPTPVPPSPSDFPPSAPPEDTQGASFVLHYNYTNSPNIFHQWEPSTWDTLDIFAETIGGTLLASISADALQTGVLGSSHGVTFIRLDIYLGDVNDHINLAPPIDAVHYTVAVPSGS